MNKFFVSVTFAIVLFLPDLTRAYLSKHSFYVNKTLGIRFLIPGKWIKSKTNEFTRIKLVLYNPQGGKISLVSSVKTKINLKNWIKKIFKEKIFKQKKIKIQSKSNIKISGKDAFQITGYKKKVFFSMIFFVHKQHGLILSYSCKPKQVFTSQKNKKTVCAKLSKDFSFLVSRIFLF